MQDTLAHPRLQSGLLLLLLVTPPVAAEAMPAGEALPSCAPMADILTYQARVSETVCLWHCVASRPDLHSSFLLLASCHSFPSQLNLVVGRGIAPQRRRWRCPLGSAASARGAARAGSASSASLGHCLPLSAPLPLGELQLFADRCLRDPRRSTGGRHATGLALHQRVVVHRLYGRTLTKAQWMRESLYHKEKAPLPPPPQLMRARSSTGLVAQSSHRADYFGWR